jgi:AraC-like DNA-binding protein
MHNTGMTKARSMGPVVAAVQRAGGSVPRLFRRAELPQRLVDHPNCLIPLRDQLKLVEFAAFEIGDPSLPARLSTEGGVKHLGAFGDYVCAAPRLDVAIARCNAQMSSMLQSATRLRLLRLGANVMWTYSLTDDAAIGRQKNEILALGYMIDLMRRFMQPAPVTMRAQVPGAPPADRSTIQDTFGCEIARGEIAALIFPACHLELINPGPPVLPNPDGDQDLPDPSDMVAQVERLIILGLLERRPTESWVCRRLRTSSRSMQRALAAAQTSYEQILGRVLRRRAAELVSDDAISITHIGYELGYSDPAHFTRAFTRWFGESPQSWRRRMQAVAIAGAR